MHPRAGVTDVPVVSVVLCVRNGATTMGRQLAALARQDLESSWEVVLVDNGSTDGTRALAVGWTDRMPCLRIVDEPVAGLNRARNRAVGVARADRIVCCDADDEVDGAWVREMVAGLERFDVVGGALVARPDRSERGQSLEVPQSHDLSMLLDHRYAVGASLGFHRHVFDAIGGFDEDFDTGADEVEFCVRAARADHVIGFVPGAVTRYTMPDTAGALMRQRFRYGRGRQRLLAKADRCGWISTTRRSRWRDLAAAAAPLAWTWPQALAGDQRLPYVAHLAHVVGEATELALAALPGGREARRARRARDAEDHVAVP
jgi:glycosyltransferase involved in cell wall biosynthesis